MACTFQRSLQRIRASAASAATWKCLGSAQPLHRRATKQTVQHSQCCRPCSVSQRPMALPWPVPTQQQQQVYGQQPYAQQPVYQPWQGQSGINPASSTPAHPDTAPGACLPPAPLRACCDSSACCAAQVPQRQSTSAISRLLAIPQHLQDHHHHYHQHLLSILSPT